MLGQVISEVSATGAKQRSFVYAGGQLLAIQRVTAGGQAVEWPYFDASGASHRVVNVNGFNVKSAENDPLGANAGLFKPITWPPPSSPGKIEPFYGVPELNSATQGCVADGVPIPCDMALPMLTNGFATLTHIDPLLASAGKKRPVWIPQDTSYGTANLNTLVVTIYSGSGGYFVWVEETVGQKLSPQNPVSEEIVTDSFTKSEVDQLYSGLEGILANKRCNDFIAALLTEAGLRARNKPIETDMLKLFNKVTQQKGFAFATKYSTGPAGTSMQGYNGVSGSVMHGDAQVLLSSQALTNYGAAHNRTRQFFLYTALGELTHIAGERSYGGVYGSHGYGDEGLAIASKVVADRMGIALGPPPDSTNHGASSNYYHNALEFICGWKK